MAQNTLPPLEWIHQAIKISSVTSQSNKAIVDFLSPLLETSGLKIEIQKVVENGTAFFNLIGYNQSLKSPNLIVFHTHLDTVTPGDVSQWTKTGGDPYCATIVRDRIYGLGTADVKLDFLCKLWAIKRLGVPSLTFPLALVGSFGEERGLNGVRALLDQKIIQPSLAFVGEPSELNIIYSHKGHIVARIDISRPPLELPALSLPRQWKGKSAHSATPTLGVNAIDKAIIDITKGGHGVLTIDGGTDSNKIPDQCNAVLSSEKNSLSLHLVHVRDQLAKLQAFLNKYRDQRFQPSKCTVSLNQIKTYPKHIEVTFDVRMLPRVEGDLVLKKIETLFPSPMYGIRSIDFDPPLKGSPYSSLVGIAKKALKECGLKKSTLQTKPGSTEAAIYEKLGAQAIVFGPGKATGNIHRPNEYNSLRQLKQAVEFYERVLKICSKAVVTN